LDGVAPLAGDAIGAAIDTGVGVGRDEEIHPEAVRLVCRQVKRDRREASAVQGPSRYRMFERNEGIRIPAWLEPLIPEGASGKIRWMLPGAARPGGREDRAAGSLEVARLDVHAFDGDLGAHQDLKALPLVARRRDPDRVPAAGRVIAEHVPGLCL